MTKNEKHFFIIKSYKALIIFIYRENYFKHLYFN